jgi:hypothetical protein
MNERVRELARRVVGKNKNDVGSISLFDEQIEQFAELIVRECSKTAANFSFENKRIHPDIDPRNMPDANRMVYHATCQCVAMEIKHYFGVK